MPPKAGETDQAWNDRMAAKYDPERLHETARWSVAWLRDCRIRRIVALLQAGEHRVLEVGCGIGYLLGRWPTWQRVGVDFSGELLGKAARRLGATQGLVQADAHHLPFRDRSWSRVYCSEVLEHVRHPRRVIREMVRVTRPGGVIVLSVPNERLIHAITVILRRLRLLGALVGSIAERYARSPTTHDEWHWHTFRLRTVVRLLPSLVRVTHIEGVPCRWFPLQWIICCEVPL